MLEKRHWFTDYNVAVFTLVFMNVQFLYIEGWTSQYAQSGFYGIDPFVFIG